MSSNTGNDGNAACTVRKISYWIFFGLLVTYGYFAQTIDNAQVVTRLGLTLSLIEDHQLTIDKFANYTKDEALLNGHFYPDKPPGLSLLALPAVSLVRAAVSLSGYDPASMAPTGPAPMFKVYAWAASLGTVGVLTALAAVMVLWVALALGAGLEGAVFGALAFGLGTPAFGWATAFFGHAATGGLLFLAFGTTVLLAKGQVGFTSTMRWLVMVGFLLGLAVSVEIFSAIAGAAIGVFALVQAALRWRRPMAAGAALAFGGLVGLAPLLIFDTLAFGSPLSTGYANVSGFQGMKVGFFGISTPDLDVIGALLFGAYRGLLPLAPVLIVALIGFWVMVCDRLWSAALVCLAVTLSYLAISGGYYYWDGGAATGPRYLVPILPFMGLALAFTWSVSRFRRIYLLLLVVSIAISTICVSVDMFCARTIASPLLNYLIPAFLAGQIQSVTVAIGLSGLLSLTPLLVLWCVIGVRVSVWLGGASRGGDAARCSHVSALRSCRSR